MSLRQTPTASAMDSSMYNQWVQSPIQDNVPVDLAAIATTNELGEFTTLTDLTAPASVSQSFYPTYAGYYLSSPYTMAYGTPWHSSVPLSNYSSLNGATTSSSTQNQNQNQSQQQQQQQQQPQQPQQQSQSQPSQQQQSQPSQQQQSLVQQQQQQQSPQQQHQSPQIPHQTVQMQNNTSHMMIDPALTHNGPSSSSMQSSFALSPSFTPSQPQTQQQQAQQTQQQQQMQQQQSPPFYGHLMYASSYYRPQPSAPQGTLSPQALHSPTNSIMSSLIPQTFLSHQIQSPIQTSPPPQHQQQQQQQQPAQLQPQQRQFQQQVTSAASSSATPTSTDGLQVQGQTPPAQSQGLTTEARESRTRAFEASIRPLLQPNAFSGAQAVNTLTSLIADYGASEVDAAMRLEILARIRDGAGNHYYRAWSENTTAMDITREWLRASARTGNTTLVDTTMPLLHLIDRLPLTFESLIASKLGKIILKLVKDEPSPAIKDMASNLERRWRTMLNEAEGNVGNAKAPENKGNEDAKTKKRKLADGAQPKPSQASKKAAVGSSSASKPQGMKREPNAVASSSKSSSSSSQSGSSSSGSGAGSSKDAAKADSSFFSAPKQKAKLPSFKKAPPVKKEDSGMGVMGQSTVSATASSSYDAFQEALKSMNRRKDSPAVSTPPSATGSGSGTGPNAGEGGSGGGQPGLGKNGKRKKTVTWANDDQLESIKLIERAVYDDDPVDGTHFAHSLRDLDRGEGAALHSRLFEETGDWAEPMPLALSTETPERGGQSEEKKTQEEREQTALSAMYMSANQIPDSPAEPTNLMSEDESEQRITHMTVGEMDAVFWAPEPPVLPPNPPAAVHAAPAIPTTGIVPAGQSVAELVGQLGPADPNAMIGITPNVPPVVTPNVDYTSYQTVPPDQLQQLLQQLAVYNVNNMAGAQNGTEGSGWASGSSNPYGVDYGSANGYHEDTDMQQQQQAQHGRGSWGDGRGRGGRGRGRGRGRAEEGFRPYMKRKPCTFFAAGRCKYGDQCDFSHDPNPN
ncbi:hypothetical protein JR316_0005114 [Psilocybe cubensis]|uniref:Serine/threonine-protein phosphatase 1 regulatory subunit 10 n=2 Tax=Psilocybe cubensis TaxID=181762 RepID=A0A8H8CL86_PSICU|nr:hypothetical protein JR316_0005114 [Psilocybe cubensis]KAH9483014.1 hypothetical protein JR316_0005114 [Psilocybe cubensis]